MRRKSSIMGFNFEANASAQQLADILPIGVAILNNDDLISVNRRFSELVTCSGSKFFECWSQSIHDDDYRDVVKRYNEATAFKQSLRIEYRTRDPGYRWLVLMLDPLGEADRVRFNLGGDGDGGVVCTVVDITAEKQAELSQRSAAREAQDRKQQQERFIDMISHEIRNPLSAILHCTEDILEAIRGKEKDKIALAEIVEAAETIGLCIAHQKKIVNDVLTFSKLDSSMLSLSPRRVQPKRHITSPLAMFRPELRKQDIQFEYKLDYSYVECEIDWVMADFDRISQILINLLGNAIKFTAESTNERKIRVSMGASIVRPSSYPPNVVFFNSSESALRMNATNTSDWGEGDVAYIMVAVKDTGIGITDQAQKRLFERFNQATPKTESIYGGSGLGLNVSRKLSHLHGGEIGVSSKEGQGSTFGFFFKVCKTPEPSHHDSNKYTGNAIDDLCVDIQALGNEVTGVNQTTENPEIPVRPSLNNFGESKPGCASDERAAHTSAIAQDVAEESATSKHVLLVEDNTINRRIISRKLSFMGFHITEAANGEEALRAVEHNTFECILMDQEMPIMDGNTTTKAIRDLEKETGSHISILGVTANVRAEQQAEMLDAGMDDVILKPYGTKELVDRIHHLIATKTRK
ncbi:CheY-like superfamily [Penicillium alfredii]|uniref:histidine kinase n=1 Tax=Penicillium alfredii TaxID=1506179 RepID=A0A9W9FS26_9EURO|nr:CheY-like superfamily [Penicillium alfredii]KAJ5104975.1 CheY-like superfamily [Penicillium alfredii]